MKHDKDHEMALLLVQNATFSDKKFLPYDIRISVILSKVQDSVMHRVSYVQLIPHPPLADWNDILDMRRKSSFGGVPEGYRSFLFVLNLWWLYCLPSVWSFERLRLRWSIWVERGLILFRLSWITLCVIDLSPFDMWFWGKLRELVYVCLAIWIDQQ